MMNSQQIIDSITVLVYNATGEERTILIDTLIKLREINSSNYRKKISRPAKIDSLLK